MKTNYLVHLPSLGWLILSLFVLAACGNFTLEAGFETPEPTTLPPVLTEAEQPAPTIEPHTPTVVAPVALATATAAATDMTAVPSTATPIPPPPVSADAMGRATGQICFPSEYIPAMTAYFQNTGSHQVVELAIEENQPTYSLELSPGEYIAYAWQQGFVGGGLYSQAIRCGLGPECADRSPLPFQIAAGQTSTGIDLCDWYLHPSEVPWPPGYEKPTFIWWTLPSEPSLSFAESLIYQDQEAGFEFDYPASWVADPPQVGGDRGYFAQLTSWPRPAGQLPEEIPAGGTILTVNVLRWEPQYDLDAYINQRKIGWNSSGFKVILEEVWYLADDRRAVRFVFETSAGEESFFMLTTVGERYLVLSGSGDLDLLAEIAQTLRPCCNN